MRHQSWMLQRIEPEKNIRRYYYIGLGKTLLDLQGTVSVYRIYGRIGGAQQRTAPKQFDDPKIARAFVQKLIDEKLERGYVLMDGEHYLENK